MEKQFKPAFLVAEIAVEGQRAPDTFLLFKAGWVTLADGGRFLVDHQAFKATSATLHHRGNDLVIDYEHQAVSGGKAPAAGWITGLTWEEGRGIYATVNWTEEGGGYVAAREYRYFSPFFYVNKRDSRLAGLHSVALTNTPRTNNLTPILARLGMAEDPAGSTKGGENMDFEKILKAIIKKLGLPEEADEEAILAALDEALEKEKKAKKKDGDGPGPPVPDKEILAALDMESGDLSAVVAGIYALKQTPRGMVTREEFQGVQAKLTEREVGEAVQAALDAGKITPDQTAWASGYATDDMEGFKAFVAKAPVVVPLEKLPSHSGPPSGPSVDAAVAHVAKQMDVSLDDVKTYGLG